MSSEITYTQEKEKTQSSAGYTKYLCIFYIPINNNGKSEAINLRRNDGVRGPGEGLQEGVMGGAKGGKMRGEVI